MNLDYTLIQSLVKLLNYFVGTVVSVYNFHLILTFFHFYHTEPKNTCIPTSAYHFRQRVFSFISFHDAYQNFEVFSRPFTNVSTYEEVR